MRIAILGAGFAGLASAWYLFQHSRGQVTIDIFDPVRLGEGVSGISSGLLHPFAGKSARKVKDASEKLDAVHALFSKAGEMLGRSVVLSKGILRPTINTSQIMDFKKCAELHPETEWWSSDKCKALIPGLELNLPGAGGLFIKQGLTIDVPLYLDGLMKALTLFGAQFHQKAITKENELKGYNKVIFAMGHSITHIPFLSHLPIEAIKGQVLTLKWPKELTSLPFSLVSEGYLVMGKDLKTCFAGATFERGFTSSSPDPEFAIQEIRKKITPFFPKMADCEVLAVKSGIRAAGKGTHQPVMGKIDDRFWFITGLGGKGLLYHGYLGEKLAKAILHDDLSYIPSEFMKHSFS